MSKLTNSFYRRHAVDVAKDLLGKILVFGEHQGIITETEAYRGEDDPASHAFKRTNRSEIMYGAPGFSYVYLIYGMYNCLNIVCEPAENPAAVLIRGLKLPDILLNGPGKICKYLNITREHNGIHLIKSDEMFLLDAKKCQNYETTARIGITKATDKLWRFASDSI